MTLPRDGLQPVLKETAWFARGAFPDRNVYLRLHDMLGILFDDEAFSTVYSLEKHPLSIPGGSL